MSCTLNLELTDREALELSDWLLRMHKIKGPTLTDNVDSGTVTSRILDKMRQALRDAGVVVP